MQCTSTLSTYCTQIERYSLRAMTLSRLGHGLSATSGRRVWSILHREPRYYRSARFLLSECQRILNLVAVEGLADLPRKGGSCSAIGLYIISRSFPSRPPICLDALSNGRWKSRIEFTSYIQCLHQHHRQRQHKQQQQFMKIKALLSVDYVLP
jgi:hypothetical protein